MHMIIRNIVYAEKPYEALQKAKDNMYFMIGDDGNAPFDYYSTFDDGGTNYWGSKYPSVAKLGTKMGRKLVCDGWRYTLKEIREYVNKIKDYVGNASPVNFLEHDINGIDIQYFINSIGEYKGSSCWLYDDDGQGIKKRSHLSDSLNKWRCLYEDKGKKNPNASDSIYIVPADVHF